MTNELMIVPLSAKDMQVQVNAIQEVMKQVMEDNVHYGKVPGCGDKPTLLKPGAEKICLMFGLAASFEIQERQLERSHREYTVVCTLKSRSGAVMGQGVGTCSTMESKYRYRGNEALSTGRPVPREYWDNNKDPSYLGGKGFVAQKIDGQWMICEKGERKENPDIADTYNTVLKIAKKRSHVDATLTTTAASDFFTQDIEDIVDGDAVPTRPKVEVVTTEAAPQRSDDEPPPYDPDQHGGAPSEGIVFKYKPPFKRKDEIKALGARWNKETSTWDSLKPLTAFTEFLAM